MWRAYAGDFPAIRKPNPPKLDGALQPKGNSVRVNWIKQDDGGSPILLYLVRYRPSPDGTVVVRSDARVSSLTVKKVEYTDAGQYLCTAHNAIGEDAQAVHLEVLYTPKIQGAVAMYTWEGNAVNISCEVQANPSDVSLVWLRDGQPLPNANSSNIKVFQSPVASFLEVTPVMENDYGSYNCTASNDLGTESKEFLLIQADVPSAPALGLVEPFSSTARIHLQEPEATGGVPVLRYRVEWRPQGHGTWAHRTYEVPEGSLSDVTVADLRPETSYEVKLSAINGKGEGEASPTVLFKTEPVRKPNPPKLDGALQPKGNSVRVNWIKQDDGGSPILLYLVRYRPKHTSDWMPEMRLPSSSEYATLGQLRWDTEYEVYVVAENRKGKSQPGSFSFRTSAEPSAIPDVSDDSLLNLPTGIIAGILVGIFLLLLLAVDVTCYFVNKCGLLMCLCAKPGAGTKEQSMEEGTVIKYESKEPIMEVRTKDECTANHNAGGPTEPNETTPLTEPELAACTPALALDNLSSSVAANSATATYDPAQDSPSSETTTLTYSLSTPANDPSPTPVRAPAPTPESHTAPANPPLISNTALVALHAKASLPVSSLASSPSPTLDARKPAPSLPVSSLASSPSPTLDARKPAPSPPRGSRPLSQPKPAPIPVETETPVQTAASVSFPTTAAKPPARPEQPRPEEEAGRAPGSDGHAPALTDDPVLTDGLAPDAPTAFEPLTQSVDFLNPAPGLDQPLHNHLPPAMDATYDVLTPELPGPRVSVPVQLTELPNGLESPAQPPPVDLINVGRIRAGCGSDAGRMRARCGPACLTKVISEERRRAEEKEEEEEAALTTEHNNLIATNCP
ncbi:hypothetical protein CRUP_027142 [Coryphaenoides rupestris]|nr:hypothetical protein CRUP_027142 [Coryphaenoides rupestris]